MLVVVMAVSERIDNEVDRKNIFIIRHVLRVVGKRCVSGPSLRFEGEEKERYLAEIIKKYVREIEQRL